MDILVDSTVPDGAMEKVHDKEMPSIKFMILGWLRPQQVAMGTR